MYQLDDEFKKEIGLAPSAEADEIYAKVEKQVNDLANARMLAELSDAQIDELDGILDGDQQNVWNFLNANLPTWEKTPEWAEFRKVFADGKEISADEFNDIARDFAYTRWLNMNVPTLATIIAESRNSVHDAFFAGA